MGILYLQQRVLRSVVPHSVTLVVGVLSLLRQTGTRSVWTLTTCTLCSPPCTEDSVLSVPSILHMKRIYKVVFPTTYYIVVAALQCGGSPLKAKPHKTLENLNNKALLQYNV